MLVSNCSLVHFFRFVFRILLTNFLEKMRFGGPDPGENVFWSILRNWSPKSKWFFSSGFCGSVFWKKKKTTLSTVSDVLVVKVGSLTENAIDSLYRCHFRTWIIKIDFSGGGGRRRRRRQQQQRQPGVPTVPPSPAQGDRIIRSDPLTLIMFIIIFECSHAQNGFYLRAL